MDFRILKKAVERKLDKMNKDGNLFIVETDKDTLWNVYLNSFPEGTNPMFRKRREYDCQCCKSFIRKCGGIVMIDDQNRLVSIWDVVVMEEPNFQVVVNALARAVKARPVHNVFLHNEPSVGKNTSLEVNDNGTIQWSHFYYKIPDNYFKTKKEIGPDLNEHRTLKEVFKRGLGTISLEAIDTVLELIGQKSLYKGEEYKRVIETFREYKEEVTDLSETDNYCWRVTSEDTNGGAFGIRNTVIGTLLIDLSDGVELNKAVTSFETKVAPSNYKRPKALVSKRMIEEAQKACATLGIEKSLHRRYAVAGDVTINNVLFSSKKAKASMNIFDDLKSDVTTYAQNLKKVEDIAIGAFITEVLPKIDSMEILLENNKVNNLMSLIAPKYEKAPSLFKWGNNFSWAYNGDFAASIRERVKAAGGDVEGDIRMSLAWFNYDDLDLHLYEPGGGHISFSHKVSGITGCRLDVDMNAGCGEVRDAVENITCPDKRKMKEGIYKLEVHSYNKRESSDVGFEVEIAFDGKITKFVYTKAVGDGKRITAANFRYSHAEGLVLLTTLPSTESSKKVWGINTSQFHYVNMMLLSPNYWNDSEVGHKHFFFILDGCENKQKTRGFFNEYLNNNLLKHRKVFEILGGKLKAEYTDGEQLSGLGFSSTQKSKIRCRVKGSFTRELNIII